MHRADFTPVNGGSLMRTKFDEISMHMEEKMGHPLLLLRCGAGHLIPRQIAIYSGYAKEMMPLSWKLADKRTYVHWAKKEIRCPCFWYASEVPLRRRHGDKSDHDDAGIERTGAAI